MTFLLIAASSLIGAASPAQDASPQPSAAAAAAAPAKSDADKKVCRREETTGSIMTKRTCHTKAEWTTIDAANHAAAQDAMDRNNRANR